MTRILHEPRPHFTLRRTTLYEGPSATASWISAFAILCGSNRDSVSVAMIRRELGLFLIVGCLTALIDFLTYRGLVWVGGACIDIAKGAGFLLGSALSYFANRFCTFSSTVHQRGSLWRFGLLYAVTLGANVIVNAVVWKFLTETRTAMEVAFLFATGISASLNFIGMKRFVFRAGGATELQ